ncbi:hypothetical protein O1R50_22640 [Glycomyces luteolus]|uniref:Uncharacterized protein n=1 Tax=Glycomyces luteolus TaxID=2670330 RepID=A0A9X3T5W6_9ACTN|nr:hypothetical protein [Glycomyces luteolus]MDA1362440.1 hypothetical protein [Glycomyces luteolus]
MKPLLTRPGSEATIPSGTAETAVPHTRTRPPISVQAIRLLLIAAIATVIATWLWAFQGVQAYAWPGVDNDLAARGLAYLAILGPAVPVNLLAAIRLARSGRRARLYLAAAAALAVVQTVLLLTPSAMPSADTMSDGSNNVGIRHLATVGPLLFAGLWLATTSKARAWLSLDPSPRRTYFIPEAAVCSIALAGALLLGTEVRQWANAYTEPLPPGGEYAEAGTWAALEQAVTETTDAIPEFAGFTTRTLDVVSCEYATPTGNTTYRYELTYELRETASAPIATRWAQGDFTLTYDGDTLAGNRRITAERDFPVIENAAYPTATGIHAIALAYTEAGPPTLHLESPCVERTTAPTECILPQGDPATDTINGVTCRN